ncbi:MAG: hypothetical protein FJ317_00110 [SAR202 cluster bacterium]|nr:hypothetical protein [SAR202 cluster bacterium]
MSAKPEFFTILNLDSIYYGVVVVAEEGKVYRTREEAEADAEELRQDYENPAMEVFGLVELE